MKLLDYIYWRLSKVIFCHKNWHFLLSDKYYLKCVWHRAMSESGELDLDNPKTFNEKLQWLKLYDRKPSYTKLVDKYESKILVGDIIGKEHVIQTLAVYKTFDEIDFDELPSKFVLKCTHDSGSVVVCKNKAELDINRAREILEKGLQHNFYYNFREWPYKNVPPRIIAEEYMEDEPGKGLKDYKIFCFDGEPKFLYLSQGLEDHSTARISFLNTDWTFAPFKRSDFQAFEQLPEKPKNYELMLDFARKLSKGIPHVRVDLYNVDGEIYFSELTFFTCSGMIPFEPKEYDLQLGALINLPVK